MRVLVAAASRHGGTEEIAAAIADELRRAGLDVDLRWPAEVGDLRAYDAVVLGSAVYMGRWLEPARELADRLAASDAHGRVWLFSSGPIGGKPLPDEAVDVADILAGTGAREHRLFGGRLDRRTLGFAEKALVMALRAPDGDSRDWGAIRAWGQSIAAALAAAE
ncbi:MAG: flavodoxin [Thermomicrobiaceae bacterium]|nr:flavodoxin [Thermomicrobiaceae bacterium]